MATSPISSDLGRDPGLTCLLILARWFERAVDGARLWQTAARAARVRRIPRVGDATSPTPPLASRFTAVTHAHAGQTHDLSQRNLC